jgi:hypothetical protein
MLVMTHTPVVVNDFNSGQVDQIGVGHNICSVITTLRTDLSYEILDYIEVAETAASQRKGRNLCFPSCVAAWLGCFEGHLKSNIDVHDCNLIQPLAVDNE